MGCGASREDLLSSRMQLLPPHPDDFGLEFLELQPCGLIEFDDAFNQAETVLNQLVELNNDINDCVLDVFHAYSTCADILQLEVKTSVPDTDWIILDLLQADKRTRPQPADVRRLVQTNELLQEADACLEKARLSLHAALASANTPSAAAGGDAPKQSQPVPGYQLKLQHESDDAYLASNDKLPEIAAFNKCLRLFRDCLGPEYHVKLTLHRCLAPGASTVRAGFIKRRQTSPSNPQHNIGWVQPERVEHEPATTLDLASLDSMDAAGSFKQVENDLVRLTQSLAVKTKELPSVYWQVIHKHKVTLALMVPDAQRRNAIRRLLVDINHMLYHLSASAIVPIGGHPLSITTGEVAKQLCQTLCKQWEPRNGLPAPLKALVKMTSSLAFKDAGIFEFSIATELSPAAEMRAFPACLPQPAQELLIRLEMLSSTIASALKELPNISSQIDTIADRARDFYDLVPEAAAKKNLPMMEAVKAGKAVGTNLQVLFDSQALFSAFAANVRRVADDLANSQHEIDRAIAQVGLATEVRRDLAQARGHAHAQ